MRCDGTVPRRSPRDFNLTMRVLLTLGPGPRAKRSSGTGGSNYRANYRVTLLINR